MRHDELSEMVRRIVGDPTLTFHQRRHYLAAAAESVLDPPAMSDACRDALEKRIICDMFEGNAPYRARYILPDYAKALACGSASLELEPPTDFDEALNFLLMLYQHVPSITGYPVYLGDLDALLMPFVGDVGDAGDAGDVAAVSDEHLRSSLRRFWIALDRTLPDAFVHANIGPTDNRVARAILDLERELLQVVPNLTLKVDPEVTPDDLVLDAVRTVFECAKPHFVNHPMMVDDLGERYGVVSCYNSLRVGGGAHTLNRLDLRAVALQHSGPIERFFDETLPYYVELTSELIESRVRFLVEEAGFFEHEPLAVDGLISLDEFAPMFGVFGLAEAVATLLDRDAGLDRDAAVPSDTHGVYGHDVAANELSYRLIQTVADLVAARPMPYSNANGGRCWLHSQSGIDTDSGTTAGTRLAIGTEPPMWEHIEAVAPHHRHFASGVSDIFHVEDTARRNPEAMVDIIRGAFRRGMRDFTFNLTTNGFVRITGYLVRVSDLQCFAESGARHGSTTFAAGSMHNADVTKRAIKRVGVRERAPSA